MALCPFAKHKLMPYNGRLPKRDHAKTLILHTNGGGTANGSLYGWFSRAGNDICSHFQVAYDGTIEQYVDTDHEAYAQFSGNAYGVSVETEDEGNPSKPWTTEQLTSIVKLANWLGCPARVSPDGAGGGIGWHSLYADWNQSHHNCPGSVRTAQIHSVILPALAGAKPHPHPSGSHPTLHKGDHSDAVGVLQRALNATPAKPDLDVDDDYGDQTAAAVKHFKTEHKAKFDNDDGTVVGATFWKVIDA